MRTPSLSLFVVEKIIRPYLNTQNVYFKRRFFRGLEDGNIAFLGPFILQEDHVYHPKRKGNYFMKYSVCKFCLEKLSVGSIDISLQRDPGNGQNKQQDMLKLLKFSQPKFHLNGLFPVDRRVLFLLDVPYTYLCPLLSIVMKMHRT